MIGLLLVIAFPEWDMPGIEHGLLEWHNSTLTNDPQEVSQRIHEKKVLNRALLIQFRKIKNKQLVSFSFNSIDILEMPTNSDNFALNKP